jgi:hypothetical protein
MKFVLIFWWSYLNNDLAVRSSVYPYPFATMTSCQAVGEKWLDGARPGEIETRHAYSCEVGNVRARNRDGN